MVVDLSSFFSSPRHTCIVQLDTAEKKMQLLYTDMTEEEVSGADFEELLRNRHLMLAGLQAPAYTNCSTGMVLAAPGPPAVRHKGLQHVYELSNGKINV